jgi:hypothetical protein
VQVYRFNEEDTSRFALTRDVGGARLPVHGAVWRYAGPAQLTDGQRVGRVKAEILRKGYFLWPDDAGRSGVDSGDGERALD